MPLRTVNRGFPCQPRAMSFSPLSPFSFSPVTLLVFPVSPFSFSPVLFLCCSCFLFVCPFFSPFPVRSSFSSPTPFFSPFPYSLLIAAFPFPHPTLVCMQHIMPPAQKTTANRENMNNSTNDIRTAQPAFRPYLVHVEHIERLSPHFQRITCHGDDLDLLGTDGYDQRIKVMFPLPDETWGDPQLFDEDSIRRAAWYDQWRKLPAHRRNVFRTYTIRAARPDRREITIDFVLHDQAGPAGEYAAHAQRGDEMVIIGPHSLSDRSSLGIDFHPAAAHRLLLIGDETAVPAIGAILDSLTRDGWQGTGKALLEVPCDEDVIDMPDVAGIHIDWGTRGGRPHGSTLTGRLEAISACSGQPSADAMRASADQKLPPIDIDRDLLWEVPQDNERGGAKPHDLYAWVAGEAAMVRDIRRMLVEQMHMNRSDVAFMGYWRAGKSES